MKIGFLGLGHMGAAIAGRLLQGGHQLVVWNRSPQPAQRLAGQGALRAASPAEAFDAEVVMTMLADDHAVESVVLETGALNAARPDATHVVLSTISTALSERLETLHAECGVGYVAAPVLGRPDAAAAGELNVLAAGEAPAVEAARPLLELIGRKVWPLGAPAHRANVVKLACNFALASMIETLGEAGALAQAWGVEPAALYEVMTGTLFAAPAFRTYAPMIAGRRFEPAGFAMTLGLKDVRLALQAGEAQHAPLPIASLLRDHFLAAIAAGGAQKDWSALSEVAFRNAGLDGAAPAARPAARG